MNLTLLRRYGENETTGRLLIDGDYFCRTLELPWRDNAEYISCIPEGTYGCRIRNSPKHGVCIELKDVPARTAVQIHIGNTVLNTLGCILVGLKHGRLYGRVAVLKSGMAFKALMELALRAERITITIEEDT